MKKNRIIATAITVLLCSTLFTACRRSEFGMSENTPRRMTVTAENADKKDFFMVGTLEVGDGEQVVITPDLEKGSIRIELIGTPEEQSIDVLPELNGEPAVTADLEGSEEISAEIPAGNYMLRATCLQKATGTVQIEVAAQ